MIGSHERYSRQQRFRAIGKNGQQALASSCVAIVGMGALGCVLAQHMARSGVGKLVLIDRDVVEPSNLQRQMLYDEQDAIQQIPKVIAAKRKLKQINSMIEIDARLDHVNEQNASSLLAGCDVILDGTDNLRTRLILNKISWHHQIPWIYGGVIGDRGMFGVFRPGITACLQCLLEQSVVDEGETCNSIGVISPAVAIVASEQAAEAMKLLVGDTERISPYLEFFTVWDRSRTRIDLEKSTSDHCLVCHNLETHFPSLEEEKLDVTVLCGRDTVQISPYESREVDLKLLEEKLLPYGHAEQNPYLLKFETKSFRMLIFSNLRVLVQGTEDPSLARKLYDKYVISLL